MKNYTEEEWKVIEDRLRYEILKTHPWVSRVHINIRPSKPKTEVRLEVIEKKTIFQKIKELFK